ncbi:MAG: 30S ribosomal protein S16 [Patescibacteria group bacterium]|nr:30S ribosomal protein S16 [Patescibacteria group bacterium]
MVKIRLSRTGTKNQLKYRIIATDQREKRDGKQIEILGSYDPTVKPAETKVSKERYAYWISVGAQVSPTVKRLVEELK